MVDQKSAYRIERDFLGEKRIPTDAYYGVQTVRAVENFPITGLRIDQTLIRDRQEGGGVGQCRCRPVGQEDRRSDCGCGG
jgi:aspartate ammonia-lyase